MNTIIESFDGLYEAKERKTTKSGCLDYPNALLLTPNANAANFYYIQFFRFSQRKIPITS